MTVRSRLVGRMPFFVPVIITSAESIFKEIAALKAFPAKNSLHPQQEIQKEEGGLQTAITEGAIHQKWIKAWTDFMVFANPIKLTHSCSVVKNANTNYTYFLNHS